MTRLLHYSSASLTAVRTVAQPVWRTGDYSRTDKPHGLWVCAGNEGTEDGWADWTESEMPDWHRAITHATEVVLRPHARVLRLTTPQAVRMLAPRYPWTDYMLRESPHWRAIAAEWQGIVISPYQWECRLATETSWYYTWDVASGCIWDADAVEALVPRPDLVPEANRPVPSDWAGAEVRTTDGWTGRTT